MAWTYPADWSSLQYPWVRAEVMGEIRDLADPAETRKWLAPDFAGPMIGIKSTLEFFLDDRESDAGAIGCWLFDQSEVDVIGRVVAALMAIHDSQPPLPASQWPGKNAYYLSHPLWPDVVSRAVEAHRVLSTRGVAQWED